MVCAGETIKQRMIIILPDHAEPPQMDGMSEPRWVAACAYQGSFDGESASVLHLWTW